MNRKKESGITLVALIVSVVIMIILASVTLNTTFTAYETTRAEKFKAQMKVLQESVTSLNAEWHAWQKEKEDEYREEIRNKELALEDYIGKERKKGTYNENNIPEELKVKSEDKLNPDGTLPQKFYDKYNLSAFLEEKRLNLANKDNIHLEESIQEKKKTFEDLELQSQCKNYVIADFYGISYDQNNIDLIKDISTDNDKANLANGKELENSQKIEINKNIGTNIYKSTFYKFDNSKNEIEYYLGVKNIDFDTVYIDVENLFIFTDTNPVTIDGTKIYTQYSFSDTNAVVINDTESTISNASILVDVIANYGTSKKITLTLDSEETKTLNSEETKNNKIDYKIRKAYYSSTNKVDVSTQSNIWYEVDDLKECEYSEDGKSVTFVVYESGDYKFRIQDVSGGYTAKMKQNVSLNIRNAKPNYEDVDGYYNISLCNAPVLNQDMVPVKWMYNDANRIEGRWVICTTIDPEWYNYSQDYKMWANVMFIHDKNTNKEIKQGIELSEKEMGSMFVWIPRYSTDGNTKRMNFLRGTSKTPTTGQTPYNISSDFAFKNTDYSSGGWDSELKGLWYSKYDIGLEDVDENATPKKITKVNTSLESIASNYNKLYSSNQTFRAVSKPYYITWRNISFTSAFSQALMYYNKLENASEQKNLNSHLMKKSEFDVLKAISSNEFYGNYKDGEIKIASNTSNKLSAGSDGVSGYSFQKEHISQSSTGNITGIFDIKGTTEVLLSTLGPVLNSTKNEKEYLYNNLMQKVNVIDSYEEEIINKSWSNSNKYYTIWQGINLTKEGKSFVKLGETYDWSEENEGKWTKVSETVNPNYGFRIVIANSPSGDSSNYLYDSSNITEIARDDLPGFYVTDEDGNYIKNADGKFLDESGNKTFYPWSEMIDNGWIKVEDGVVNYATNINELKQKTGILIISNSDDIHTLGMNLFANWFNGASISTSIPGNSISIAGNLLKVKMGDNIKKIEFRCFYNCRNLTDIQMSNFLTDIGDHAFYDCDSLVNYTLPEYLETIGVNAFLNCRSIESITIPRYVKVIKEGAFSGCSSVTSLEILSEQLSLEIGADAFAEVYSSVDSGLKIKSVVIPANVSFIGEQAFRGCRELETIVIKDGVKKIQNGAFAFCTKLTKINFPNSIESLGGYNKYFPDGRFYGMLQGCSALENVDLSFLNIDSLQASFFSQCSSLKEVKLPSNLKVIGDYCFASCSDLIYLEIPDTINEIEEYTFFNGQLTSEEVPTINLNYMGNSEQWHNILKTSSISESGPIKNFHWYSNINVIVETSDGEIIEYMNNE